MSSAEMRFEEHAYSNHMDQLFKKMNNGEPAQREIDHYLLAICMIGSDSPLLLTHTLALFVAMPEHVLTVQHMPDIGRYISCLIINQNYSAVDTMSKLIHYSMPYIKHNCMNFPSFVPEHASILPDIINIMLTSCIGLYPECAKKPLMSMCVKLVAFVHTLKATGNALDLYIFCTANMCLLCITMIEYFVYFISTHMPNETKMLTQFFGLHQNITNIFKQVSIICNTFQHQCLQHHALDITHINVKAQITIDKCNRVCKGKSRTQPRTHCKQRQVVLSTPLVRQALGMPVLAHAPYFLFSDPAMPLQRAHAIREIHSWGTHQQTP